MVKASGNTSEPKNASPIFQFVTLNPKYTQMMPIARGMRSVTIHTHHTSP
jgi:hypothetical protein